ncbi:MAG: hypothetical protein ACREGD_01775 [Candidatus Saccharimonadales bacterium]
MEQLRQQVIATQRKINDLLDKPGDPAAARLKMEVQGLEDDLQSQKNPLTIEDRVKRIINLLEGDAKANRVMNLEHLAMFRSWFEGLRNSLRRMG